MAATTEQKRAWRHAHPEYMRGVQRRRKERARAVIAALRQRPCHDCGLVDPVAMEFDHVPERGKKRSAPLALASGSVTAFLAEVAKCDMVCANCHRHRTAARLQEGYQ